MQMIKTLPSVVFPCKDRKNGHRYKMGLFKCPICGKEIALRPNEGLKALSCSMSCREMRYRLEKPVRVHTEGYLLVPSPNNKGRQVYQHRLIMEQVLGRPLKHHELVHHIDRNRANNNKNNLMIVTRKQHHKLHH